MAADDSTTFQSLGGAPGVSHCLVMDCDRSGELTDMCESPLSVR